MVIHASSGTLAKTLKALPHSTKRQGRRSHSTLTGTALCVKTAVSSAARISTRAVLRGTDNEDVSYEAFIAPMTAQHA